MGGGGAETINLSNVAGYPNEDANLVSTFDLGQCAPTATVGDSYQLSTYYQSSVPVYFNVFGRAADGTWSYWTGSPTFPATAPGTWGVATWLTPAVPSSISALSYGMTINEDGTLTHLGQQPDRRGTRGPPGRPLGDQRAGQPLAHDVRRDRGQPGLLDGGGLWDQLAHLYLEPNRRPERGRRDHCHERLDRRRRQAGHDL